MPSFLHCILALWILTTLIVVGSGQCNPSCGVDAVCSGRVCSCPAGKPDGDPRFICHGRSIASCNSVGDPLVTGFADGTNRMNFPCKTTLARFDTPASGGPGKRLTEPGNNRCRINLEASNILSSDGMYYIEYINATVIINKKNSAEQLQFVIKLDDNYITDDSGTRIPFQNDGAFSATVKNINFNSYYNRTSDLRIVEVDNCGTTFLAFRYYETAAPRSWSGVTIATQANGFFTETDARFPSTQCDRPPPSGSDSVYMDFASNLLLNKTKLSALYAFLKNPPNSPQDESQCLDAVEIFKLCPPSDEAPAINTCGPYLDEFAVCGGYDAVLLMEAFNNCILGFCTRDVSKCLEAYNSLGGNSCPGLPSC